MIKNTEVETLNTDAATKIRQGRYHEAMEFVALGSGDLVVLALLGWQGLLSVNMHGRRTPNSV